MHMVLSEKTEKRNMATKTTTSVPKLRGLDESKKDEDEPEDSYEEQICKERKHIDSPSVPGHSRGGREAARNIIIIIIIHDNIEEAAIPNEAKGHHASLSPISFQDPSAETIVVLPSILSPVADNFDVPDNYDVPMVMPYILQLLAAGTDVPSYSDHSYSDILASVTK